LNWDDDVSFFKDLTFEPANIYLSERIIQKEFKNEDFVWIKVFKIFKLLPTEIPFLSQVEQGTK